MPTRATTPDRQRLRIETGRRLHAIRTKRQVKQMDLAAAVGVPASTISGVESGARGLQSDTRVQVARILGIDSTVLDPAATPDLDLDKLLRELGDTPAEVLHAQPVSGVGSKLPTKLPEGLEAFLGRHPQPPRIRWYLENSTFRTEPWVVFNDKFWAEQAEFWKRYLRELDEESGDAGEAPARKGPG